MNLAEMLRGNPLAQKRLADNFAMDQQGDLARMMQQHGTVQDPARVQEPQALGNLPMDVPQYTPDNGPDFSEQLMNLMPIAGMLKAGGKVNPYLKGVAEGDELIGMHNLSADNLAHAQEIGGLPVPSIGIAKANAPLEGFGDISLIARQDMVTPGRGNPVVGADAYSKRYPNIVEHNGEDKIFKGFTNSGNRRYAPHTLDNVVKEMKGPVTDTEGWNYGAGSLRSNYAPKFRTLEGIQKARDQVVPEKNMPAVREEMNERLFGLADDLLPYDKHYKKYELGYGDTVTARLGPKERLSDYYEGIPPELSAKISKFKKELVDSPTAYFEAKPQRGVQLQEFGGAIVPDNVDARTLEILKRNGIENVERYGGAEEGKYKTKAEAMKQFRDLMFSTGGSGFLASQLSGQDR